MTNLLVVADDLTGTLDTGHAFAAAGRGVSVTLASPDGIAPAGGSRDATDVLAVDTDSRYASPERAARGVEAAVSEVGADLVYKKVDSTLRGNVVAEVDATLDASKADVAVVAPAFPGTGRTTRGGVHRVDGTRLDEAGYGVEHARLRTFFAASRYPVVHLDLDVVAAGADAVGRALAAERDSTAVVTCDATTADHLAAVAAGAAALEGDVLYVGSGGLAKHVAVPGDPSPGRPPGPPDGGVLGVVGSVNERTLRQLGRVPATHVVKLDPAEAARNPDSAAESAVPDLREKLERHGRAVVTAATEPEDVERAEVAAREGDAGDRVGRALALAATGTAAGTPLSGLFLTGGDVARRTLDAFDVASLGLAGRGVGSGVPEGWVADGSLEGTRLVTKAGGFGSPGVIVECLDYAGRRRA